MDAINWNEPIEAVHTDGRVVAVTALRCEESGSRSTSELERGRRIYFNGTNGVAWGTQWYARNVQPAVRTADEALTRMERLVERMAGFDAMSRTGANALVAEARAIQALRKPVDPRLAVVTTVLAPHCAGKIAATIHAAEVLAALDAMPK